MRNEDSPAARLLITEDHALVREGLRNMLESEPDLEVVGEAANGLEALELCRELEPNLVLMDVRMPKMDGLEATRAIKAEFPLTSVLMVTSHESPDYLLDAIRAGAAGYVLKEATRRELLDSVRKVLDGENTLDQGLAMRLLQRVAGENNHQPQPTPDPAGKPQKPLPKPLAVPLSVKELEAVRLIAVGEKNREIARAMMVSMSSAKTYIKRAMLKLQVSDRTQTAVRAIELGLISSEEER